MIYFGFYLNPYTKLIIGRCHSIVINMVYNEMHIMHTNTSLISNTSLIVLSVIQL